MPACTCRRWRMRRHQVHLDDVCEIFDDALYRRPQAGRKVRGFDVYNVGGIPIVIKALLDAGLLHGDC